MLVTMADNTEFQDYLKQKVGEYSLASGALSAPATH